LRADGFIIRAQAAIRTDGFFVRAGFAVHACVAKTCALRAPTPSFARIHTIRAKDGVLEVQNEENVFLNDRRLRADGFIFRAGFANTCALRASTAPEVNFEMRP
jgi:hypothetical protein